MVPNARFNELLVDIEPSVTTKSQASSAHNGLRGYLRGHEDFSDRWLSDFLAGSYSRDTAIRPRTSEDGQERPDVDIVVVTTFATSDAPDDVLEEVADALIDAYTVDRINKRSVRVTAWNAEMDVVPVIKLTTGVYMIPDRDAGGWKPTNPPAHDAWSTAQNAAFDGRFKKLVKMVKWWRRENPTSKRPKGFVLEVLVAMHAPREETHLGEAFAKTLENIHASYAPLAAVGVKPFIADPATGLDILAKVTVPQWKEFIEKVRVHADYARRAQTVTDIDDATRLWRKIFGPRFRSTVAPAKAASASSFASAVGPAGGYTFPNLNATPTKPRGFA